MACARCSSVCEAEFAGELMLHFPSPRLVTKRGVLTYPMILVCLNCGAYRFNTPTEELPLLREGAARSGAA
jgi:hypothetical protein